MSLGQLGKKPDRQRARVRIRFIGVIREFLDGVRQVRFRVEIELLVIGAVLGGDRADSKRVSSKLRPRKEIEKVFSLELDACAA